jgi:hypothetical protein
LCQVSLDIHHSFSHCSFFFPGDGRMCSREVTVFRISRPDSIRGASDSSDRAPIRKKDVRNPLNRGNPSACAGFLVNVSQFLCFLLEEYIYIHKAFLLSNYN